MKTREQILNNLSLKNGCPGDNSIYTREECLTAMKTFGYQMFFLGDGGWQNLANSIRRWSDATFGDGQRNPAIVHHLKKEVDELLAAMSSDKTDLRNEYADCLMLLLDSASHAGLTMEELHDATLKKLEINKTRTWGEPDENGVIEHIK